MFELFYICFFMAGFLALLVIPYSIFICVMWCIYRATGGKMGIVKYFSYW